jgi:hypothetical protein
MIGEEDALTEHLSETLLVIIVFLWNLHLFIQTHSFSLSGRSSIALNQLGEDCSLA